MAEVSHSFCNNDYIGGEEVDFSGGKRRRPMGVAAIESFEEGSGVLGRDSPERGGGSIPGTRFCEFE
jgi:hypothetical protein